MRRATTDDTASIRALIVKSSRALAAGYYDKPLIESALRNVLGVDRQLIIDGTYYVAEKSGTLIGCGGWSFRETLYGSDEIAGRDNQPLNPQHDAARIRAFFVDPDFVRQGIASMILQQCEKAARQMDFTRLELGATRSGVGFYKARGFVPHKSIEHQLLDGRTMEIVPMSKSLY